MLTPIADASAMRPGRILYIHKPVISAAGIVTRIVNMPQELSASAFTTTIPTLASVQMMMNSVAMLVVTPATGPIVSRAILRQAEPALPHRGPENHEIMHGARQARANHEPNEARRKTPLRGQHRSNQRSRSGDRGEMVPKQHPFIRGVIVAAVAQSIRRRWPPIIEHRDARREECAIETIRHRKRGQRANDEPKRVQSKFSSNFTITGRAQMEQAEWLDRRGPHSIILPISERFTKRSHLWQSM